MEYSGKHASPLVSTLQACRSGYQVSVVSLRLWQEEEGVSHCCILNGKRRFSDILYSGCVKSKSLVEDISLIVLNKQFL